MKMLRFFLILFGVFEAFHQTPQSSASPLQTSDIKDLYRQESIDTDDSEDVEPTIAPVNFGPQVAQIITGALTGNLNSILSGSFNLVQDPQVKNNINGAWGTIAGIPSSTVPPNTTVAAPTTVKLAVALPDSTTTISPGEEDDDEDADEN